MAQKTKLHVHAVQGQLKSKLTSGSIKSTTLSQYALKMSAEVMIAVLHTALLGLFKDFTTSEITFTLLM